jgi:hypothetical protein
VEVDVVLTPVCDTTGIHTDPLALFIDGVVVGLADDVLASTLVRCLYDANDSLYWSISSRTIHVRPCSTVRGALRIVEPDLPTYVFVVAISR